MAKTKKPASSSKATAKRDIVKEQLETAREQAQTKGSGSHVIITETDDPKARWYVVHTYSGHEQKIAQTLLQRAKTMKLERKILEILIPTQDKIMIKQGKKSTVKEHLFPGYMTIRLILDDGSWLAVRTTQGITRFSSPCLMLPPFFF